jgi:hypothetical protein
MQKWHLKLAFAFIDMARVNAYVTKRMRDNYRASRNPHQDFMIQLASEMISGKWNDSVDEGGIFIAEITRASDTSRKKTPIQPTVPPTPTTPAPSCAFVLSSEVFPAATRGKRGCKVCVFEGRTATMKTLFCEEHKVCLCSGKFDVLPSMASVVCPHHDWSCWRKFHDYYLPKGLYNSNGNIVRSSKLHLARRALNMNEQPAIALPQLARAVNMSYGSSPAFSTQSYEFDGALATAAMQAAIAGPQFARAGQVNMNYATSPAFSIQSYGSNGGLSTEFSPHPNAPLSSPPTLVVSPFDGVLANAAVQADAIPSPYTTPFTPGMISNKFESVTGSDIARSSVSHDFAGDFPTVFKMENNRDPFV